MGLIARLTAPQFTRPANTTQYTAGDLVADNTTAGSVTAIAFRKIRLSGRTKGKITGGLLRKSAATVTVATFRLHLFAQAAAPTVTNGDNGAIVVNSVASYIGFLDFDFTTAANNGNIIGGAIVKRATAPATPISFDLTGGGSIYGLIEATGAYTPTSGETFDASLDVEA